MLLTVTELKNLKLYLVNKRINFQQASNGLIFLKMCIDKMIASELLKGIPLLVLANKQDLQDSMGVREVKPIFNQNAHLIGQRDCMVMPVSALNGYAYFYFYLLNCFMS